MEAARRGRRHPGASLAKESVQNRRVDGPVAAARERAPRVCRTGTQAPAQAEAMEGLGGTELDAPYAGTPIWFMMSVVSNIFLVVLVWMICWLKLCIETSHYHCVRINQYVI